MIGENYFKLLAGKKIDEKTELNLFYQRCKLIFDYVYVCRDCDPTSCLGSFSVDGEKAINCQRHIPEVIYNRDYWSYINLSLETRGLFFPKLVWKKEGETDKYRAMKASAYTWGIVCDNRRKELVSVQIKIGRFDDMSWGYAKEIHIENGLLAIEKMCKQGNLASPLELIKQLDGMISPLISALEESYTETLKKIVRTREIIETENIILSKL